MEEPVPDKLMVARARRILLASICVLSAAWPAAESGAQWQKNMVCPQCGIPAPQVPARPPRYQNDGTDDRNNTPSEEHHIDHAAEQAREEAKIKLIQKKWIPISPTSAAGAVTIPQGNPVSVAPGTRFFNTVPSDSDRFTAPVAHAVMAGTPIPVEALRRAVAILAAAEAELQRTDNENEETAFLASQAAAAMEGAPLKVLVNDVNGPATARAAEAIRPIIAELGQHQAALQHALATNTEARKAYAELKKERDADDIDPPQNVAKHRALIETYMNAKKQAAEAKQQLKDDTLKIATVIHLEFRLLP